MIIFGKKICHIISFVDADADAVNAIHCDLPTLVSFQHELVLNFPATKLWHSKNYVSDITDKNDQLELVTTELNRAHRAAQENVKQVLRDYIFPKMTNLANEVVTNCKICTKTKFDRHPQKQKLGVSPIL